MRSGKRRAQARPPAQPRRLAPAQVRIATIKRSAITGPAQVHHGPSTKPTGGEIPALFAYGGASEAGGATVMPVHPALALASIALLRLHPTPGNRGLTSMLLVHPWSMELPCNLKAFKT